MNFQLTVTYLPFPIQVCFSTTIGLVGFPNITFTFQLETMDFDH